ncbi:xanthine dehydrogenase accessory protein XdhC [Arthrobacter sp. PAMC25284]|uniref:xanthine dehydrogenase accessory protein XdhC n=1 Tax=Arthrobacter sp. PAMC25284 TaxID=2861279 RepID=UPI001C6282A4|nr:xanthine dehydrogenase accessory protein XdhC [Arthrobacter sp. PAMC25284]QYF90407.1 xanthine dehydrogenase accessory protein XdhC [Arthrobacter sp. PAMC25284]
MDWLQALHRLRSTNMPCVLATVVDVRGHAPREAGAKMVVAAGASWGSIGGGNLEATVIDRSRAIIAAGTADPESQEFRLNDHAPAEHGRQCCGGVIRVLLEPFPARPTVAIFGMGHVGHELARILSRLPLNLHLVDSRADRVSPAGLADVTDGTAGVNAHHSPVPDTVLGDLPAGSHVLIMTHDHAEDFLLCDAALRRSDLGPVGLIGSRAKWSRFREGLRDEGHTGTVIDRIRCPIGLPGITGKAPAVIAISVAARLLQDIPSAAEAANSDPRERHYGLSFQPDADRISAEKPSGS